MSLLIVGLRLTARAQRTGFRNYATSTSRPLHTRRWLWGSISTAVAASSFYALAPVVHADDEATRLWEEAQRPTKTTPMTTLLRTYIVYTMCSIPVVVDNSPQILEFCMGVPGLRYITEKIVRATFFTQFVGADTAAEAIPIVKILRSENKGSLFAYSVEKDESSSIRAKGKGGDVPLLPPHKLCVEEMLRCIDVAAGFEDGLELKSSNDRRTWVAVKMSALLPEADALRKFSLHIINTRPQSKVPIPFPGSPVSSDLDILSSGKSSDTLTPADITALKELYSDLVRICSHAEKRAVKLILDAEYSWWQPAMDAYTLGLMRRFNKLPQKSLFGSTELAKMQPLVYGTFQAYLRRAPSHLKVALQDAKDHDYALGVKLVRGAYHTHETAAHPSGRNPTPSSKKSRPISPDDQPPVWPTKDLTDASYNQCVKLLINYVQADAKNSTPRIGILFGTHNWDSANLILEELAEAGLAKRVPGGSEVFEFGRAAEQRVNFGQLFGMSDALSNYLISRTKSTSPLVLKYVPYGALEEVMPYLSRRAIENKSVLGEGGAARECKRAGTEIRRRLRELF